MGIKRLNILTHCGWGSDFAIVGCDAASALLPACRRVSPAPSRRTTRSG